MKLSKYKDIAKREGACIQCNVEGSGIWFGTKSAIYNANELPHIECGNEMRTVLDLPEKDWKKISYRSQECEGLDNVLGMCLREYDEEEEYAQRQEMQAVYRGGIATALLTTGGELVFYNASLIALIAEQMKDSDYVVFTVRKYANGRRYIIVKDGFEVMAAIMPLNIITRKYLEELAEFEVLCTRQFHREQARIEAVIVDTDEDGNLEAEQMGMDMEGQE